jgi:hypothetical protein
MEEHTRSFQLRSWAAIWLAGIEMEIDSLRARDVLGTWQKGGEEIALNDARASADLAFLAFAFQNLRAIGKRALGKDHELIGAFDEAVPSAVTLRDVFAHPEDYVVGMGRKQGENGSVQEMLDTSHAMDDHGLLILAIGGGRVDAAAGLQAARNLAAGLTAELGGPSG